MNTDLIRARQLLEAGQNTCVLCKGSDILCSKKRGVLPLIEFLQNRPLQGYSAADKVIGKATAFLYVLLGVSAVYAPVISEPALTTLTEHGISAFYDTLVPAIYNRSRSGFCPMETAVANISDAHKALIAIEATLQKLNNS